MADIVERLRKTIQNTLEVSAEGAEPAGYPNCFEAAEEIERLRAWIQEHPYSELDMDMHVEAVTKDMRAALEFYASGTIAASEDGGRRALNALNIHNPAEKP